MPDTQTLDRIFGNSSLVPLEVEVPPLRPNIPGVLVVTGRGSRFGVGRLEQPSKRRRDVKVDSLIDACRHLLTRRFDLVILLPDAVAADNEETMATLRNVANGVPVLVLSEPGALAVNVMASIDWDNESSSSDPVCGERKSHHSVTIGPLVGHRASGMITANGDPLKISPSQSRILWRLLEAPQHLCKASELVESMVNPGFDHAKETLRVHISRLRKVLANAGCDGILETGRSAYWLHWPPSEYRSFGLPACESV